MKRFAIALLISMILSFLILNEVSAQCAMCKQNAENSSQTEAKGLNLGIMYLLIVPYALVGGIGYWWYVQKKKEKSPQN